MKLEFYNIINGECRTSENAHRCVDPRTEEELWDCPIASVADLDEAVEAAKEAFKTWSKSTNAERQEVLRKIAEIMQEHSAELEEIVRRETGKSVCGHNAPRKRPIF
jgi:acyl-CoA reductase-like NAD-dependent aldehyde dehydrogenase